MTAFLAIQTNDAGTAGEEDDMPKTTKKTSKKKSAKKRTSKLTDAALDDLVGAILNRADYDLYKSIYVDECVEEPDVAEDTKADLRAIVRKHLGG